MKKIYQFSIILLILLVASGFAYIKWFINNSNFTQNTINTSESKDKVLYEEKTILEKNDFFDINVKYPYFKISSNELNQKIENLINNNIADFKKNSIDNFNAINATMPESEAKIKKPYAPFDYYVNYEISQLNKNYISLVINIYYFSGGAHGVDLVYAFNYDIKNQKEITIQDILNNSQDNLNKLSNIAYNAVIEKMNTFDVGYIDDMIKSGTEANYDNFQNFNLIDNGSLIIYFQKYQVAPGSVGLVNIAIFEPDLQKAGLKLTLDK